MKIIVPQDLYLVATGRDHVAGEVIDVPAEVGENLVEQGWTTPEPDEPKNARKKPASDKAAPADPKE